MVDATHALLLAVARDAVTTARAAAAAPAQGRRTWHAEATRAALSAAPPDALEALLPLAGTHRMIGVAGAVLDAAGVWDAVAARVVSAWQEARITDGATALQAARQLAAVARILDGEQIAWLAYKGPALAQLAYGDVGLRACSDIDVVVPPRDRARAREALQRAGFAPRHGMSAAQERVITAGQGHAEFVRLDEPAAPFVELHWRFASRRLAWSLDPATVIARSTRVSVGGASVRVANAADHTLLLALHGARHAWSQLEWLVSFASLAAPADFDPDALARASAIGARRALVFSAFVAHWLVGVEIPPAVRDAVKADPALIALALRIIDGWQQGVVVEALDEWRLIERARDRVRWTTARLFYPTMREWEAARLPGVLAPLYVPMRLARLALRGRTGGDDA